MWIFTRLNRPKVYGFAVFNRVNPIRAGVVKKPEDYRWCSLGYHTQTGNKDPSEIPLCGSLREFHGTSGLLDIDFGLKEWNELDPREIVRKYRQFVYETGAVDAGPVKCSEAALSQTGFNRASKGKTIDKKIVEKARKKGYRISRVDRFRYRCRYSPG